MMRRAAFLAMIVVAVTAAYGQTSEHYFIDGFGIKLPGGYEIYVVSHDEGGGESTIEIVTPAGDSVYGILFYDEDKRLDGQSYILPLIYEEGAALYSDEGFTAAVGEVEYDTLISGSDCYWATVESGDAAYVILAADLYHSPGNAVGVFFCFPPFFGLDYETQVSILEELANDLFIEFYEAAG